MKFPKTPKWLLPVGAVAAVFLVNPGPMDLQRGLMRGVIAALVYGSFAYFGTKVGVLVSAVLLYVFVIRKEGMEGMEGKAIEGTSCPKNFEFDVAAQMCKDAKTGAMVKPTQVVCESGYKPNDTNDKCVQDVPPASPPPPPPSPPPGQEPPAPPAPPASSTGSATANAAAPANAPEPFTGGRGTVATTPGAAQEAARGTVVLQQQGGAEPFRDWNGAGYPLQ